MADRRLAPDAASATEPEQAEEACEDNKLIFRPGDFLRRVIRDWMKSRDPQSVITDKGPSSIGIGVNTDLNLRIGAQRSHCTWTWIFEVRSMGHPLKNLVLSLDAHREHFGIRSVYRDGIRSGFSDGQEWHDPVPDLQTSKIVDRIICYTIEISFAANGHGTYRQNLLFGFDGYPVIRKKICADIVPVNDLSRLNDATKYFLNQTAHVWSSRNHEFHQFESPFVPATDPWEKNLAKAYPYPGEDVFILSHATLTEDCLTRTNYRGRMHELISVEELARHEQVARYNTIVQIHLSSCYILSSDTDGSTTAKYAPLGELFAQLPLGRGVSEDMKSGRLLLRGCNSILIKLFSPHENTQDSTNPVSTDVFEAHVEDKCNYMIYARLSKSSVERLNLKPDTDVKMYVQFVLNRLPFCEWHRAVDCLPDTRLVFPDSHYELSSRLPSIIESNKNGAKWCELLDNRLNDRQREAVKLMIAPIEINLPPILLLGPYGTGKTFTIAQALLILLLQNPVNKVLLCTQSNSAADLYVKEFFDEWYTSTNEERLKPMRIYYKRRLRTTVHPTVRKYCLVDPNGYFRDPTKEDLDSCGLIVTTLATSGCLTALDVHPTHIVIDEAAQALECEALTPLALVGQRTRIILSGDQMQLAPEVYSDLSKERGLGTSLLERLHNVYSLNHPCRVSLCQNYRSHAEIVRLTSNLFYGNEIEPSGPLLPNHPNLKPLLFYAVQGIEVQGQFSTGYYNDEEAVELAKRIASLKSCWPVEEWGPFGEDSIGVLAHYSEQVARIRNELRKRKLFSVSVERVLNVQGKQFTAVFISTVRTRNCCRYSAESAVSDYGFLTNPRLLNTAITRAKALVAVVGDPVALLTTGSCRSLWGKYFQKATVRGIPQQLLTQHVTRSMAPPMPLGMPLNPLAREFVPRQAQRAD